MSTPHKSDETKAQSHGMQVDQGRENTLGAVNDAPARDTKILQVQAASGVTASAQRAEREAHEARIADEVRMQLDHVIRHARRDGCGRVARMLEAIRDLHA
jgi:hypothetical protein